MKEFFKNILRIVYVLLSTPIVFLGFITGLIKDTFGGGMYIAQKYVHWMAE